MFAYEANPPDAVTGRLWENDPRMGGGEFFVRQVKRQFATGNTIGLALTEADILDAEREAGTYDPDWGRMQGEYAAAGLDIPHPAALSEEAWKASPDYDKRIAYAPNMTPQRARILKENLDRRDAEDRALARDSGGAWRTALSFGAGLVAALPDPVNLIPFGAGARGAGALAALKHGMIAGAAGNVAADAVLLPWAAGMGEDVGFAELARDAIFGAALGAGFGALGHAAGRFFRRAASDSLPAPVTGERSPLPSPEASSSLPGEKLAPPPFDETPDSFLRPGSEVPPPEGGAERAAQIVNERNLDRLRNELLGEERVNAGRLVDAALRDIDADRPLDVYGRAREMGFEVPFMPDGRPPVRTADMIASGGRPFWGRMGETEMLPLAEAFYRDVLAALPPIEAQGGRAVIIRGESAGWGKMRGRTPDADKLKLLPYIDRILAEAEWVFTEPARRPSHAAEGVALHDLLAAVEYEGRVLEVRLKVREAQNGKFFYDFFNESEPPRGGQKKSPPDSRAGSVAAGPRGGENSGQWELRDSSQREGAPSDTRNPDTGVSDSAKAVNLEIRDITPDRTPEPAERMNASVPTPEERERLDGSLQAEALRLAAEGRAAPEELAVLERTAADIETANREENALLGTLECILGAAE
jgi:hypothetical protein